MRHWRATLRWYDLHLCTKVLCTIVCNLISPQSLADGLAWWYEYTVTRLREQSYPLEYANVVFGSSVFILGRASPKCWSDILCFKSADILSLPVSYGIVMFSLSKLQFSIMLLIVECQILFNISWLAWRLPSTMVGDLCFSGKYWYMEPMV